MTAPRLIVAIAVFLTVPCIAAARQESIAGHVLDSTKAVLPGVTIEVTSASGSVEATV